MTDIFREVEEDVRRERIEKIWTQYRDYIIAGAALIIIAIAGYEIWLRYEQGQQAKASSEFNAAIALASRSPTQAADALTAIAASAPNGYAQLARLAKADALLASGDRARAVAEYEALANGNDDAIGNAARIRAAWVLADTASKTQLQTLLAPLTNPTSAWRHLAREVLAYADYRASNYPGAESQYRALADDPDAPQPLKRRAQMMAAFLKAGGNSNFGFVPQPTTPVAPPPGAAPAQTQQGSPTP